MKYILSKYNYFRNYNNTVVGVNLFEKRLFKIDKSKYDKLLAYKERLEKIKIEDPVFFSVMYKLGIINEVEYDNNIKNILLFRNKKIIFSSDSYWLTILPTLNCNFNCWYCYEDRSKGLMNKEIVNATIKFIENTVKKKSSFFLDWYGGEPLLCYEKIMKPISEKTKEFCELNNVFLESQITTNGYLLNEKMLSLFRDINMQSIQITLNGPKEIHNRVRYQKNTTDSYDKIVNNIVLLAENLNPKALILRINFAKDYFDLITKVIESFPLQVRKKIKVLIKQIDQDQERISFDEIGQKLSIFEDAGFNTEMRTYSAIRTEAFACQADKYDQSVISYDGRVFKCHGVNFNKEIEDGILTKEGIIEWNEHLLLKKLNKATFDNKKCLNCNLLPICYGICSYKLFSSKNRLNYVNKQCLFDEIEKNIFHIMDKFYKSENSLAHILN